MLKKHRDREEKPRFRYHKRKAADIKKRANQSGGNFDSIFKDKFPVLKLKEGSYRIRILPPTWKNADHYGYDVYVHNRIGADGQSYLCLKQAGKGECPVCDEIRKLERSGDADAAKEIKATKRVAMWLIDRNNEEAGPMLWAMPWMTDKEIASLSKDEDSGEMLCIDDPEEGFDVSFNAEGEKRKRRYVSVKIARKSSPLSDDEDQMNDWLAYVQEHPVPTVMNYYDPDHIAGVFAGGEREEDEEEEEDDADEDSARSRRRRRSDSDDEDEERNDRRSSRRSRSDEDEDEEEEEEDSEEAESDDEDDRDSYVRKSKRRREDEEEDDSDSEDEDEEEEDEDRPSKGAGSAGSRTGAGSRRARKSRGDEDEDGSDEDEDQPRAKIRGKAKRALRE